MVGVNVRVGKCAGATPEAPKRSRTTPVPYLATHIDTGERAAVFCLSNRSSHCLARRAAGTLTRCPSRMRGGHSGHRIHGNAVHHGAGIRVGWPPCEASGAGINRFTTTAYEMKTSVLIGYFITVP